MCDRTGKEYILRTPSAHLFGAIEDNVREWFEGKEVFVVAHDNGTKVLKFEYPNGKKHYAAEEHFVPLDEAASSLVNHPAHYLNLVVEVKDIIKDTLIKAYGPDAYKAYCLGNELKYRLRAGDKDSVDLDLGKAGFYRKERNGD